MAASAPGCFPDPPADDGLLDSGIFISDGTTPEADIDSGASGLELSTTTIDFGLNDCGGVAPKNQTLTLTNASTGAVTYAIAVAGYGFSLATTGDADDELETSGTIAAGQSVDIPISALGVSTFATAGGLIEGALQVVTDAPGQKLFVVDLKETAAGAQLTMIPNMAGSVADFGLVQNGGSAEYDVSFRNNGNEPITVTFDDIATAPFALENQSDGDAGPGIVVAPNSTTTLKATFNPLTEEENQQEIGFHTTGVTCGGGDSPAAVRLQGEQGFSGVSITPGTLVFDVGGTGFVPCGKVSTAKTVTVTNPVGSDYPDLAIVGLNVTGPFTATLGGFDPADASSSVPVPAGTNVGITISPQTVKAPQSTASDGVSGTLEIDLSNEDSLTVQLSQTAQGAVLEFTVPSMNFGDVALDVPRIQNIGIVNSGNAAVGLTLGITGSPYFTASPSANFSVNTPMGEASLVFLPIAAGPAQATLSLTPSGAVCSSPVNPVPLTGNGITDAGAPDTGTPILDAGALPDAD